MSKMTEITPPDPTLRTFMLFMQMAHAVNQFSDNRLVLSNKMKTATYIGLKGLIVNGGEMSHTKLAEWTNTRKHNITGLVDRMKRDGFVTTERSTTDRRLIKVAITDKGRATFEKASPVANEVMSQTMHGLNKKDVADLERVLKVMKENIIRQKSA